MFFKEGHHSKLLHKKHHHHHADKGVPASAAAGGTGGGDGGGVVKVEVEGEEDVTKETKPSHTSSQLGIYSDLPTLSS
ncbi:hypothetical protein RRG08_041830 [Elysia crispata]|uniref:Uncharacterized protein n=1 Tax=Elysia crispata TaxID=231223 RepID=A0AAE0Y0N9_9GAST|nr:hypothetical protein RRG08_041830 [Elysia crispata]